MNKSKFEELKLSSELLKAVSDMGFEYMSPIQEEGIPEMLKGIDIIGQAQTGTGKTAAFGLPLLEKCNPKDKSVQAIVLCPTRELSIQVADELEKLGKYKRGISILPIYGGQPIDRQIRRLKSGVQIVVGTPGRVIDHIRRKTLKLGGVETVVLDEADEMFDMGFRDDIEIILQETPKKRQTVFFSATMPPEIKKFTKMYQRDPKLVKVVSKNLTADKVEQYYYNVKGNMKTEAVDRLLSMYEPKLSIVFCNTKRKVDELATELESLGYLADGLHGDLSQPQRDRVMNRFRAGKIGILVATDVAARGIDVDDVDMVFNYDLPQDEEYYVHRIGRTGRAGREGYALSLLSNRDKNRLREIERYTKMKLTKQNLPSVRDIENKSKERFIETLKLTVEEDKLKREEGILKRLVEAGLDLEDIAKASIHLYLKETEVERSTENKNIEFEEVSKDDMDRIFIGTGKRKGVTSRHILGAIMGEVNMPKEAVGKIDIFDKFTFVNVDKRYGKEVVRKLNNKKIKGNTVRVEFANKK